MHAGHPPAQSLMDYSPFAADRPAGGAVCPTPPGPRTAGMNRSGYVRALVETTDYPRQDRILDGVPFPAEGTESTCYYTFCTSPPAALHHFPKQFVVTFPPPTTSTRIAPFGPTSRVSSCGDYGLPYTASDNTVAPASRGSSLQRLPPATGCRAVHSTRTCPAFLRTVARVNTALPHLPLPLQPFTTIYRH